MKTLNEQHLVDVPMYTMETFFTLYPDRNLNDFMDYINENDVMTQTTRANNSRLVKEPYTGVRRVVIDDLYLNWLSKHDKRNTTRNLKKYMKILSDIEVEQMWKENKDYRVTNLIYIPVVFFSDKGRKVNQLPLKKNILEAFESYAKKELQADDLVIFPQLLRTNDVSGELESQFLDKVISKLLEGEEVEFKSFQTRKHKEKVHIEIRFLLVGYEKQEPVFHTVEEELAELYRKPSNQAAYNLSTLLADSYRNFSTVAVPNLFAENPQETEAGLLQALFQSTQK